MTEKVITRKNALARTTSFVFFLLAYFVFLSFIFLSFVAPIYGTTGFSEGTDWLNSFAATLYLLLLGVAVIVMKNNIKRLFFQVLLFFVLVPMLVLYANSPDFHPFHAYMAMVVVSSWTLAFVLQWPMKIFFLSGDKKLLSNVVVSFMILMILGTLGRHIYYSGWGNFNLDFSKVYYYRFLLRELLPHDGFRYVAGWSLGIFSLFCIIYFTHHKKWLLLSGMLVLQGLLFGFSSHKSVIFDAIAVLFAYYTIPWFKGNWNRVAEIGTVGLLLFLASYSITKNAMVLALFHRVFFLPAGINFWYYEFFSDYGFMWFRHAFLRPFFPAFAGIQPERMIGLAYFHRAEVNANTGFLGSGYMEGGFLMMMIYAVAIGLIINLFVAIAQKKNYRMVCVLSLWSTFTVFLSVDLSTALLTGGLGILLLLLWFLATEEKYNEQ